MENIESLKEQLTGKNSVLERWRLQTPRKEVVPFEESKLEPGDTISATPAFGFIPYLYHYGIYVGNREVVHVQKEGIVKYDLDHFCNNRTKVFIEKPAKLPHEVDHPKLIEKRRELIVETAESMVGEKWEFHALSENCESFTNWVTTGKMHSQQGIVLRNSMFLYGVGVAGYILGRGKIRPWRVSWWKGGSIDKTK